MSFLLSNSDLLNQDEYTTLSHERTGGYSTKGRMDFDSALVGKHLPQNLLEPSTANWNLSGQSPSILLRKTVLSLKSPTGAFIVLLRSTNANFQISLCK